MDTEIILSRKTKSENLKWHILRPSSPCDSVIYDIYRYKIRVPVFHVPHANKYDIEQFYGNETITIRTIQSGNERTERRDFYVPISDICKMCISNLRRYEKYLNRPIDD
jgi:hypothetical protein